MVACFLLVSRHPSQTRSALPELCLTKKKKEIKYLNSWKIPHFQNSPSIYAFQHLKSDHIPTWLKDSSGRGGEAVTHSDRVRHGAWWMKEPLMSQSVPSPLLTIERSLDRIRERLRATKSELPPSNPVRFPIFETVPVSHSICASRHRRR